MRRFAAGLITPLVWLGLTSMSALDPGLAARYAASEWETAGAVPAPPPLPPPPPPVLVQELLSNGVTIVISKPSQRMVVFRDGALWDSSPVSTGKRGKSTPSGVFAILQKKPFHRSNLYSNAPMPWMQRLTWTGIAIHAGHLPGYPASHGCIRLPSAFAKKLYALTRHSSTAVIVTDEPVRREEDAFRLAAVSDAEVPMDRRFREERALRLARRESSAAAKVVTSTLSRALPPYVAPLRSQVEQPRVGGGQTIQLAAAGSQAEAAAHWANLVRANPELARMRQSIVPAIVNAKQYYRLRATAPGAHATCGTLKRSGIACFAVS